MSSYLNLPTSSLINLQIQFYSRAFSSSSPSSFARQYAKTSSVRGWAKIIIKNNYLKTRQSTGRQFCIHLARKSFFLNCHYRSIIFANFAKFCFGQLFLHIFVQDNVLRVVVVDILFPILQVVVLVNFCRLPFISNCEVVRAVRLVRLARVVQVVKVVRLDVLHSKTVWLRWSFDKT